MISPKVAKEIFNQSFTKQNELIQVSTCTILCISPEPTRISTLFASAYACAYTLGQIIKRWVCVSLKIGNLAWDQWFEQ